LILKEFLLEMPENATCHVYSSEVEVGERHRGGRKEGYKAPRCRRVAPRAGGYDPLGRVVRWPAQVGLRRGKGVSSRLCHLGPPSSALSEICDSRTVPLTPGSLGTLSAALLLRFRPLLRAALAMMVTAQ
jgi:hypothetical protein